MTRNQLLLTIGVWFVCIVGLILYKQMIFWTGTEVLLKTAPVDPWDVFRGEYVILRYDISSVVRVSLMDDQSDVQFSIGEKVYVILRLNSKGVAEIDSVSKTKPNNNELFIQGVVNYDGVEYGIESYFVEQGSGKEIENLRGKDLLVRVVVDKNGRAVIKNLEFGGTDY